MNVPFLFAISAITSVMVIFRVPLDQATACISALAINAAADFGLYLVYEYQNKLIQGWDKRQALQYALLNRGDVIVVDIVLNAICFAPLMLSSFLPVVRLGWIMVVMLFACGFGALVLMPALLPWAVVRKKA
jgi:predicted RND superfamily exporter protein